MALDAYAPFRAKVVPRSAAGQDGFHPLDAAALVLFVFAALTAVVAPTDPDVWWHLATGRLVAASGLPAVDLYSYTAAGRPWIVQEWLTEVLMAKGQAIAGFGGLTVAFGALQALALAMVYGLCRVRGAGRKLALGAVLAYIVLAAPSWGVRPQVLTPVFVGAFLALLDGWKRSPRAPWNMLALPPLMALWANMHASFFIGFSVLLAYAVGETANRALGRSGPAVWPLWLTAAGCAAASLATPYGGRLWSYPLGYVLAGTASPLLAYTQEWQPLDFHQPAMVLGFGALLAAALAMPRAADRAPDVTDVLLGLGFTLLCVQAVRLLPLFGVAVLPLLAAGLARAWPRLDAEHEAIAAGPARRVAWVAALGVCLAMGVGIAGSPDAQHGERPKTEGRRAYPVAAAGVVAAMPAPVRVFNEFEWGGYMIESVPRHAVFIDGRADMYRERVFDDYMAISRLSPGWRDRLDCYGADVALIRTDSPLAEALAYEPDWRPVHRDELAMVYTRVPRRD
jgi:hypothetical protein